MEGSCATSRMPPFLSNDIYTVGAVKNCNKINLTERHSMDHAKRRLESLECGKEDSKIYNV